MRGVIMAAVAAVVTTGVLAQAAPILSVDFNGRPFGSGALGPTMAGFQAFDIADNTTLSGVTSLSKVFTTTAATSVTASVAVVTPNAGLLQGRDRGTSIVNAGALTYAPLYRDFIFANPGGTQAMDLSLSGLTPGGSYELRVFSYDDNVSSSETLSTVRWTVTAGVGTFGEISFQRNGVDPTSNEQYSVLIPVLADSAGLVRLRSSRTAGNGNVQVLNGFELSEGAPIPEPAMLGLFGPAALLLSRRR